MFLWWLGGSDQPKERHSRSPRGHKESGHKETALAAKRAQQQEEASSDADLAQQAAWDGGGGLAALGLGALAATLNFIPIIGPVAMFVVLVVVGLVAFPTIGGGLLAALAFGGLTFLEGHFITPAIIGRRLALNALAVLLALAFWTWLWGPMGAFLSSPLLIVALILKEHLLPVNSPQLPQA